jgi:hypothetical protein
MACILCPCFVVISLDVPTLIPSNVFNWFKEHRLPAFSLIRLFFLELYRILFLSLQRQSELTDGFSSRFGWR